MKKNWVKTTDSDTNSMMNQDKALGFLAAAIDGEGSFMMVPQNDLRVLKQGRSSLSIRCSMEIENTVEAFIDKVEEALSVLNIAPGHRLSRSFRNYSQTPHFKRYGHMALPHTVLGGGKNYHRLAISARGTLGALIDALYDDLTVKNTACDILREHWLNRGDEPHYKATVADLELCKRLFDLQGRRRNPFPMDKWLACLEGDYEKYKSLVREVTPCRGEKHDLEQIELLHARRRDQSVRSS